MPNFNTEEMSSKIDSPKFLPRKEKAILALLEGANVTEAAAKAGVHERTVRRWLKESEFQKRLSKARDEMYTEALDSLRDASSKGAKRLIKLVDSSSEKIALKASEMTIKFSLTINKLLEFERRIEELEKKQERRDICWQR